MEVFITLFILFIMLSVIKSERDRRKREALRKANAARQQEEKSKEPEFTVPEPSITPEMGTENYHGEDVPRTTRTVVREEKKDAVKELDFDPEKMIIYSEILKPKF